MAKREAIPFEKRQKKYIDEVSKALDKNPDIYQFCDLELIVPYDRATLYVYHLDKIDSIKEKLACNKMNYKRILRNEMRKTKNPTCLIALYKLLANQDERDALNNAKVELNANVGVSTQETFLQHLKDLGKNAD